jgi:galactokinase
MDQFIACHGTAGHALLLDCRSLDYRLVPVGPAARLLICNSMMHHALAGSEYNLRRAECERGVALLAPVLPGVRALRDVTMDQLTANRHLLPELTYRRCRHVISENDRVQQAAAALADGRLDEFGRLMAQSHASMRDDYEISCSEIDLLVELALASEGVLGSRMTGGGFGGCTVSLVAADAVERVSEHLATNYRKATGLSPEIWVCSPGAGVGAVAD